MAEIKTIYKGESVTLLFTFPEAYDMARLISHKVFVGETEFAGVKDWQTIRLQLKSSDTDHMIGTHKVVLLIDDAVLGLRKPYCWELVIAKTQASGSNASVSNISDIIIPVVISEIAITVGDIMYNYVIGRSAYQVWLDAGNVGTEADYFAYLQQPAADMIASLNETNEAALTAETNRNNAEGLRLSAETNRNSAEGLRLSAETTRGENEADRIEAEGLRAGAETGRQTAEGLRVQAEQARQTNTATAIQNAETATQDANDAALLANEKAGLANNAATLANTKAGLADTAATNANTKAGLADAAATNANNVANGYAAELAGKELKANKQNSLTPDGTGTKFPTVDAVNAKIGAMSGELIADYTHTSNKEVHISSIDYATNTFTSVGHGLSNSVSDFTTLMLAINRNELIYPYNVMPFANLTGYIQYQGFWVINATPNTFQLSFTNGGSAIVLLNKAETDLTKWHFEYNTATTIEITGLLGKINRGCRAVIDGSFCRFGASYIGCFTGGKTYYKGFSGAVQEASYSNWNNSDIPVPSFGGVVVHTDYYTPSGHRKLLDVATYSYTPTLNRIAFLQKVQNNISPITVPDANKTSFKIAGGAMITNGTNIKLYTI